ncbi:endonuclease Q family protein [Candidatus Bathyarchaeota archaeon]|nr:endonuclease Q family protein [Candidatus Bathyarchaeota archaeon]
MSEAPFVVELAADLHIHSRYSRATSPNMTIPEISTYAELKGLGLVGTGDLTHPDWSKELRQQLEEVDHTGILRTKDPRFKIRYVISGEVCTVFEAGNKSRKIHHVIMAPSFEVADQIQDRLRRFGDIRSDGRPMLTMTAAELVEEATSFSNQVFIFPAHIWTPWFSLFGSIGGFDSVQECYEDQSDKIVAVETGLSSDPPMNWRLSDLDGFAIISNSDAHSPWPWRIGREATYVNLHDLSYSELIFAISTRKSARIQLTIETDPAYGKYHWTGHRDCQFSISAQGAIKHKNICPKCGRKLTKGVDLRVEELADRSTSFIPDAGCTKFVHLLPLHEVIAAASGGAEPSSKMVWEKYNRLVGKFGTEFRVMLDVPEKDLADEVGLAVADLIMKARSNRVPVTPGYDGTYGKIALGQSGPQRSEVMRKNRTRLEDYF